MSGAKFYRVVETTEDKATHKTSVIPSMQFTLFPMDTSRIAYLSILKCRGAIHREVLSVLATYGPCTSDKVAIIVNRRRNRRETSTISPRFAELKRAELVIETGGTAMNSTGRPGKLWRLVTKAERERKKLERMLS